MKGPSVAWSLGKPSLSGRPPTHSSRRSRRAIKFYSFAVPSSPGVSQAGPRRRSCGHTEGSRKRETLGNSQVATSDKGRRYSGHSKTNTRVMQTMWSQLVLFTWVIMATSASVVMTRVERVCPGSNQCLPFSSCTMLQGRNKQDTLQAIR